MPTDPSQIPDATAEPAAYKQALLELTGEADPLDIFAATVPQWRAATAVLTPEQLNAEPEPGEWSVAQITGHLFDVDLVQGFRWRLMLTEDNPTYPGYDEKLWTPMPRLPFAELLDLWEGLRAANLLVLRDGWPATANRTAVHSEQGPETFEETLRKIAGHDLAHLDQLRRTTEAATR
jgi:hypothetical protein